MKKLMMIFSLILSVVVYSQQAHAKLLGIEIRFEKGTKQWNADRTETKCEGKGICIIVIKGNVGLNENEMAGTLGFDENNRFGMLVSADQIRSSQWGDTFVDGVLTIYKDITLGSDIREKLRNCPSTIPAGKYRYTVENGSATILFN